MATPMIFNVLTNFRFEVGSAILGSQALQQQVQGISDAADNAQNSLINVGLGIGSSLGIVPTGILGVLGMAIKSSDSFFNSQLQWANIISANMDNLTGDLTTFSDRMLTSKTILESISGVARKFSLPEKQLAGFTKMLAPFLTGKGLEGRNFEVSLDISRSLLKGAPTLGLDLGTIQGQMLRMIEGSASMGDTLFRRLAADAPDAFKDIKRSGKGGLAKGFNLLPATKRVDVLRKALNKFSSDADVNAARINTINNQLTVMKDSLVGLTGVLKPFGDIFRKPIIKVLKEINSIIQSSGKEIVSNFSQILGPMFESPKEFLINIMQLKALAGDVEKGSKLTGIIGTGIALKHLFGIFKKNKSSDIGSFAKSIGHFDIFKKTLFETGLTTRGLSTALRATAINMGLLQASTTKFGFVMSVLKSPFKLLWFGVTRLLLPLTLLIGVFQILSRASAKAKIEDLTRLPEILAKSSGLLLRFKVAMSNILSPFTMWVNGVVNLTSILFSKAFFLEKAIGPLDSTIGIFEDLGLIIVNFNANLIGLSVSVVTIMNKLVEVFTIVPQLIYAGITGGMDGIKNKLASTFTEFEGGITPGKAFNMARKGFIDDYFASLAGNGGEGSVVNRTTNIAKVEINNKFKEQMEPDRIAFTLVDQLQKLASNPRQARGGTMSPTAMATAGAGG